MKNNVIEVDFSQKRNLRIREVSPEANKVAYKNPEPDNADSDIDESQEILMGLHMVLSMKYGENPMDSIIAEIADSKIEGFNKTLEIVVKYIGLSPTVQNSLWERVFGDDFEEIVNDNANNWILPFVLYAYMYGLNDFTLVNNILKAADEQINEMVKGEEKEDE